MIGYRQIAAIFTLLFWATAATAGPISWSYSATLSGDRGDASVYDGYGVRLDASEPGGVRYYVGYTQLGVAANLGTLQGSQNIHLGFANHSGFFWNDPIDQAPVHPLGGVDDTFLGTFTIHDDASGLSKTISFGGTASSQDSYLGLPASLWLNNPNSNSGIMVDEIIGHNEYQILVDTENLQDPVGPDQVESWVTADVKVSPVQTPEPSSIILAAVGLIGIAGVRFRFTRRIGLVT
jgi:hypothetical protein